MAHTDKQPHTLGFTLIELSIVLVIIGLIVGGVLVGRDLIKAAQLRSLVSQVDQFKVATNTFKNKYGSLPGDMHPSKAAQFGFFTFAGSLAGSSVDGNYILNTDILQKIAFGNDNGIIESIPIEFYCANECGAFWSHLNSAGLIPGIGQGDLESDSDSEHAGFGPSAGTPLGEGPDTPLSFQNYMPKASGVFGFVGAGSVSSSYSILLTGHSISKNFFWVVPPAKSEIGSVSEPILSGNDNYAIDAKVDDGLPNSGIFIASTLDSISQQPNRWSNGTTDYLGNSLNSNSIVCAIGGADAYAKDVQYNTNPANGGDVKSCLPIFVW